MNINYEIDYLPDDANQAGYRDPNIYSGSTDIIGEIKKQANGSSDAIEADGKENKKKLRKDNISVIKTADGEYRVVGGEKDGTEPNIGKNNKWLEKHHNLILRSNIEVDETLWIHNVKGGEVVMAMYDNNPLFLKPGRHVYNTKLFKVMEAKKATEPVIFHENLTRIHVGAEQIGVVIDDGKFKLCKPGKTYSSVSPYFKVVGFLPLAKQHVRIKDEKEAWVLESKDEMQLKFTFTLDFTVVKDKAGQTVKTLGDKEKLVDKLYMLVYERMEKWFRDIVDNKDFRDFEVNNDGKTIKAFFKEQYENTEEFKGFEEETGIKVEALEFDDIKPKDVKAQREAEAKRKEDAGKPEIVKKAEAEKKAAEIKAQELERENEAKQSVHEAEMKRERDHMALTEEKQQKEFEKLQRVYEMSKGDTGVMQVMLASLAGVQTGPQRGFGGKPFSVFGSSNNSNNGSGGFAPSYMQQKSKK